MKGGIGWTISIGSLGGVEEGTVARLLLETGLEWDRWDTSNVVSVSVHEWDITIKL